MSSKKTVQIAIVDDHTLFRKGMISLIQVLKNRYDILFEAENGNDLKEKLHPQAIPDIILMDINMPGMDGFASVQWLNANFPSVKVLVVSMIEKEESIMRMLKLGVKGYLCKDVEPEILEEALTAIMDKGFYYTDFVTGSLVHTLQKGTDFDSDIDQLIGGLNKKEKEFIHYACSELTYNEIAAKMFLSPKTVEGYRYSLFDKLKVKSRVGLAIFAIKNGLFEL